MRHPIIIASELQAYNSTAYAVDLDLFEILQRSCLRGMTWDKNRG